jgi:hypothetical protein
MSPRSHLGINKRARPVCAQAGNVSVMIDEPFRIDIFE